MFEEGSNLLHLRDNLWLKKFGEQKKGQMQMLNVCIRLENGTFAGISVVYLYESTFYDSKNNPIGTINDPSLPDNIERFAGINKTKDRAAESGKSSATVEEICEEYKRTNSIRKAAKIAGVSEEKTKKILIEKGVFTSEKYEKIKDLLKQGKALDEIAAELKMSQKQLKVFLPKNIKVQTS